MSKKTLRDSRGATRSSRVAWAAYAAGAWALVFAAAHFYWGAGGTVGLGVDAAGVEAQFARDPWPYAIAMCGVGALFLAFGAVALALVRPSGWVFPRRAALAAAWVVALGLALYAATGVVDVLRLIGVMSSPVGRTVLWGNLLVWDPWWLLGAALFCAAAWFNRRGSRG